MAHSDLNAFEVCCDESPSGVATPPKEYVHVGLAGKITCTAYKCQRTSPGEPTQQELHSLVHRLCDYVLAKRNGAVQTGIPITFKNLGGTRIVVFMPGTNRVTPALRRFARGIARDAQKQRSMHKMILHVNPSDVGAVMDAKGGITAVFEFEDSMSPLRRHASEYLA